MVAPVDQAVLPDPNALAPDGLLDYLPDGGLKGLQETPIPGVSFFPYHVKFFLF